MDRIFRIGLALFVLRFAQDGPELTEWIVLQFAQDDPELTEWIAFVSHF